MSVVYAIANVSISQVSNIKEVPDTRLHI